ncbi:hypothetical protein [Nostoc sp.]
MLVIFDDVTDYEIIKPYFPPAEPRFKVMITTRLRLGKSVNIASLTLTNSNGNSVKQW